MLYRRFGKTNLKLSVFTFGAMRIVFDESALTPLEIAARERDAVATIRRAMELGINHIDTARGYGNSERLIGLALKELGREHFYVSTKIQIQPDRDTARKQIEEALRKLETDWIDILDLHGINTLDLFQTASAPDGCLKAVQEAIDEGIVGHVAFSAHAGPELITRAMDTGLFSAASFHYWWTHQRNAPCVTRAGELDMGILIISPSEKGGLLFKPTPELSSVCDPFTPLTLTHRWLLSHKEITTLTIGAGKPEEFDAHLPALMEESETLTEDESAALERWQLAEKEALGNTRCTICYKCMPCPQNVAIPEILRLRNLGRTFDMTEFGKMRYNLLGNGGHWFPGEKVDKCNQCGECLLLCPEKLDIPNLLNDTHEMLSDKERGRLWEKS